MFLKNLKFLSVAIFAFMIIGLVACSETDDVVDSSDFTEQTVNRFRGGDRDCSGCFDLIYPVTIQFADDTTAEVTDKANLKETIKAWFTNTGAEKTEENRPSFVFPVSIDLDGEVIEVTSQDEFDDIAEECKEDRGHHGRGHHGGHGHHGHHGDHDDFDFGHILDKLGYSPVFPVSISIGGEVKEFNSEEEIEDAIDAYEETLGDDDEFEVEPVFPISFTNDDSGETITFASAEELFTFIEENYEGRGRGHHHGRKHRCYTPVFPISFDFAGEVVEFSSKEELKEAMKNYRKENGRDAERPQPVFPATFKNKDTEEEVSVNSLEELEALEEECE